MNPNDPRFAHMNPGMFQAPGMTPAPMMAPGMYPTPPGGFQPAAPNQQAQKQTFNALDPSFMNATAEYDAEVDANAQLPPITPSEIVFGTLNDGYTVVASWAQNWQGTFTDPKQGSKAYAVGTLLLEIVDCLKRPEMNGRKTTFRVSTQVWNSGASSAQQIIQAAGLGDELRRQVKSHGTLMNLVNHVVTQKIRFKCTIDWEASFYDKDLKTDLIPPIVGFRSFPPDASGNPIPEITRVLVHPSLGQIQRTSRARMVAKLLTPQQGQPGQQSGQPAFNFGAAAPVAPPQPPQPPQGGYGQPAQTPQTGFAPNPNQQPAQPPQYAQQPNQQQQYAPQGNAPAPQPQYGAPAPALAPAANAPAPYASSFQPAEAAAVPMGQPLTLFKP